MIGANMKISYNIVTEAGIDLSEINEYKKIDKFGAVCMFLVAGRMIYRKGHEFLLDALEKVPDELEYKVRIVGEGPELKKIQERCSSSHRLSEHVTFTGLIPYKEMEREYSKANVFIMPSIRETTGTVLLEAMAKGIPVVTVNKFGGATILDNNTGWLYSGMNKDEYIENLKSSIIECIQNPAEVRRRGDNARNVANKYTWEAKDYHYQEVYNSLLKNSL